MLRAIIRRLEPALVRFYRWISLPPPPNLLGDRHVEYAWIAGHLPPGPGRALDFGSGRSDLALTAANRGFEVTAIDLTPVDWPYIHPNLRFLRVNLFDLDIPLSEMDLIINCSAIEHVGLGRYGDVKDADGDLKAIEHMRGLLKPGGVMLLTIPVGRDATFAPLHRVYGKDRLPRLLAGYVIEEEKYWVKDERNRWVQADESVALEWEPRLSIYGLGCFVLRPRKMMQENG